VNPVLSLNSFLRRVAVLSLDDVHGMLGVSETCNGMLSLALLSASRNEK
jgi:hypothetical protein